MEAEAMVTEAMVEAMEDMQEVMGVMVTEAEDMVTEVEDMLDIMGDTELSISVRICQQFSQNPDS